MRFALGASRRSPGTYDLLPMAKIIKLQIPQVHERAVIGSP
jgi:hypothetical protein